MIDMVYHFTHWLLYCLTAVIYFVVIANVCQQYLNHFWYRIFVLIIGFVALKRYLFYLCYWFFFIIELLLSLLLPLLSLQIQHWTMICPSILCYNNSEYCSSHNYQTGCCLIPNLFIHFAKQIHDAIERFVHALFTLFSIQIHPYITLKHAILHWSRTELLDGVTQALLVSHYMLPKNSLMVLPFRQINRDGNSILNNDDECGSLSIYFGIVVHIGIYGDRQELSMIMVGPLLRSNRRAYATLTRVLVVVTSAHADRKLSRMWCSGGLSA